MRAEFAAGHQCVGACDNHLGAFVVKPSDKHLPAGDVLYLIEIVSALPAKHLKEALLEGMEVFQAEIHQTLIVEVEKEVLFGEIVTQLLQQNRLATPSDAGDNQNVVGYHILAKFLLLKDDCLQ